MEIRRFHPKEALISLGVGLAAIAMIQTAPYIMTSQDYQEREQVLQSYPFTPQARAHFESTPFFDRHTTTNGGGHFFDFPMPYAEVYSDSPEAILHELSHDYYYEYLNNPAYNDSFMKTVVRLASEDKRGGYFNTLVYGNGQWRGIPLQDTTEYYASIASYSMGGMRNPMPQVLQPYFSGEFVWKQTNEQK